MVQIQSIQSVIKHLAMEVPDDHDPESECESETGSAVLNSTLEMDRSHDHESESETDESTESTDGDSLSFSPEFEEEVYDHERDLSHLTDFVQKQVGHWDMMSTQNSYLFFLFK